MRVNPSAESFPHQAEIIKWAREILPDFQWAKVGVKIELKRADWSRQLCPRGRTQSETAEVYLSVGMLGVYRPPVT